tara:strand:- start:2070 stop:2684 length:615 start_codon:yes stop_codon:yes gene_type:complete
VFGVGGGCVRDDILVDRLKERDPRAFDEFYQEFSPKLLRRLMRLTGDAHVAEDCLQQVFSEMFRCLPSYRGEGEFAAWVNRIATNVAMNTFRKQTRIRDFWERTTPEEVYERQSAPPLPDELFSQEETKALVAQSLKKLSSRKRMAILLVDLEGHSLEEAASQLGVPPGTVASRLYHARNDLKAMISRELARRGSSFEDLMSKS